MLLLRLHRDGIAVRARHAEILMETGSRLFLNDGCVNVVGGTVGKLIFLGIAAIRDAGTRAPACDWPPCRIHERRENANAHRVDAPVRARLDRVLIGLGNLRDAPGVMQAAAQILAPEQHERVFAMLVAQKAELGVAVVGTAVGRGQIRVEHRQINPRNAILIHKPLVGINNTDKVGKPGSLVDDVAGNWLGPAIGQHGDDAALAALNGFFHPSRVPAFRDHVGAKLLGGVVLHPVDARGVLNVGGRWVDEYVLVQREGTDNGPGILGADHGHGRFAVLPEFLEHFLGLLVGNVVGTLHHVDEHGFKRGLFEHGLNLRVLLGQRLDPDVLKRLVLTRLPKYAEEGRALFVAVLGQKLYLPVHLRDLGIDQPLHERSNRLCPRHVRALDGNSNHVGPLERRVVLRDLGIDRLVGQPYAEVGGTIPRRRGRVWAFPVVLLAVAGLPGPQGITGLVVQPALVDNVAAVGNRELEAVFDPAKVRGHAIRGS